MPHLILLTLMLIWGASYSAVKVALESLSPFAVVTVRFALGAACLALVLGRGGVADLRRSCRPGLITGAALAAGFLLQTCGLRETSASTGGFLAGLIVLLVAVGGFLVFRAAFGARAVVGLVLGLVGLAMLCWPTDAAAGAVQDTPRGILLQVASSVCFAAHILLISHFGRGAPAIAYCFWQLMLVTFVGALAILVEASVAAAGRSSIELTGALIGVLLYLGVLASGISIAIQSKVQHRVHPTHVALLFATQPLFAALVGWATLGDRMGTLQLIGGATIVSGVVLTSLDRSRPPEPAGDAA